jgi:hypothetical protein
MAQLVLHPSGPYLVELYPDPSKWNEHLELLLAAPLYWWALREAERKSHVKS